MGKMGDMVLKVALGNPQVGIQEDGYKHYKNFVAPGPKPVEVPAQKTSNGHKSSLDDIETRPTRPPKKIEEAVKKGEQQHNKLNNRWVQVDGYWFPSVLEARVYQDLKYRQMAGEIVAMKLQPVFSLQKKFRDNTGKMQREINYIADFIYVDRTGNVIVVDAKGLETNEFSIKKKLFLKLYPQYRFEIVRDEKRNNKRKGMKRR